MKGGHDKGTIDNADKHTIKAFTVFLKDFVCFF